MVPLTMATLPWFLCLLSYTPSLIRSTLLSHLTLPNTMLVATVFSFYLNFYLFFILTSGHFFLLLLKRGEGRERNIDVREKHQSVASYTRPRPGIACAWTGDQTRILGMYPDRELNPQPFHYRTTCQPSHTDQGIVSG